MRDRSRAGGGVNPQLCGKRCGEFPLGRLDRKMYSTS